VHVEEESVLIDFSAVEAAGVLPRGGFEGYVIYFRSSFIKIDLSSVYVSCLRES